MTSPRRRRPRLPSCASVLLVLAVLAAAVWTAVHAVAVSVARHPGMVLVPVIVVMALVGVHRWTRGGRPPRP